MQKFEFGNIFELYYQDVFNYSNSLLKNKDDARDAAQDVFTKALETQYSFRGECSIKTWLLVITRNYCYMKLRKPLPFIESIDDDIPAIKESAIELKLSIESAMERLSDSEYELVYLREYAGYSYNEISEIMNIGLDLVRTRLFRVRKKLQKYLK